MQPGQPPFDLQPGQPPFATQLPGGPALGGWGAHPPGLAVGAMPGVTTSIPVQTLTPPPPPPGLIPVTTQTPTTFAHQPQQQALPFAGAPVTVPTPTVMPAAAAVPPTPPANQPPVAATATVQQPAVPQPAGASQAAEPLPILALLKQFALQPGCERYETDSFKIKLLEFYFLARQLVLSLPFETFLTLFKPLADFDEKNCKLPADAIAEHLPRAKKAADAKNSHHWSAKEVVSFLTLYVDMIRTAEQQGVAAPMTLTDFITQPVLIQKFLKGEFDEEPQAVPRVAKKERPAKTQKAGKPTVPIAGPLPIVGQRSIYTELRGRQHRGYIRHIWKDGQSGIDYAVFMSDIGEEFIGVPLSRTTVCDDPPANPCSSAAGSPLPVIATVALQIAPADYPNICTALNLYERVQTATLDATLWSADVPVQPDLGTVRLEVINAEAGPHVDAFLQLRGVPDPIFAVGEPRKNVTGQYTFVTANGCVVLTVTGNQ